MEILIMVLIAGGIGYWMYKNVSTKPADKSENTGITAVGEPPATVAVEGAGAVSWHTAPPAGSALAQNTLDVNHDGITRIYTSNMIPCSCLHNRCRSSRCPITSNT